LPEKLPQLQEMYACLQTDEVLAPSRSGKILGENGAKLSNKELSDSNLDFATMLP